MWQREIPHNEYGIPQDSCSDLFIFLLVSYPKSINSHISFSLLLTECFKIDLITMAFEGFVCGPFGSVTSEIACLAAYVDTVATAQCPVRHNQCCLNAPQKLKTCLG